MPLQTLSQFIIDDEKHARLWEKAVVIFDASSLLEMYFYSDNTKRVVIDEIFKRLKDRLWMPGQVNYEFLKNRSKVILKPKGSYVNLEKEMSSLANALEKYKTGINELKSKTKKDDKHPVLDQNIFNKLDEIQKQQDAELTLVGEQIKEVIRTQTAAIEHTVNDDILYNAINTYFQTGKPFSFAEQMELAAEGKFRYEYQIPPGYEDKDQKEGTQIFGDLFIWKEIINYAKEKNKPIIYISNDIKPDWCVKNESNATYIEHPRHELLKEIWDTAEVEFWMYSNPQLLYYSKKYLSSEITAHQIQEVNVIANERQLGPDRALACIFTWPVDDTTSSPGGYQLEKSLMYLLGNLSSPLQIDWGDGSPLETVANRKSIYHQYPGFGEYTVQIYGDIFWFCAMAIGTQRGTQFPKVSELSFKSAVNLDRLQCYSGNLQELDLSTTTNLTQLLIGSNRIKTLNLCLLRKLLLLYCDNNELTDLDVSQNQYLSKLSCSENKLTSLDLSRNNILEGLNCRSNQLETIDLSNNNNLLELNCAYNRLGVTALNSIFQDLPFVSNGKICIIGNPGAESCDSLIAKSKGWIFEQNAYYKPTLG